MYVDVSALRARRSAHSEPVAGVRLAKLSYGRFLQADPIGYGDGMNMYGYVGGDPVNGSDSNGTCASGTEAALETGSRIHHCYASDGAATGGRGPSSGYAPSAKAGGFATGVSGAFSSHPLSGHGWMVPAPPPPPALLGPSAPPICVLACANKPEGVDPPLVIPAGIERAPISFGHFATSEWWAKFAALPGAMRLLETNLESVIGGTHPAPRTTVPAPKLQLPGGRFDFYQRYEAIGLQKPVPGVLSGARIVFIPGASVIYFAPFHGKVHPQVPSGYIRFNIIPEKGGK